MTTSPRTFLFSPWSHGVGFGYIGRALTIATELRAAGHRCLFACDTAEGIVARSGFEVVGAPGGHNRAVPDMGRRQGQYISIDTLDTAFAIAGYYHADRVRSDVLTDIATIKGCDPDAVVVDMQPTAALAARHLGIPVISVGDSDFYRPTANSWMAWLPDEAMVSPYPSCVPAFNTVAAELGVEPVDHVTEVLLGDLTLVASVPELEVDQEPLPWREDMHYVGPVFWDPPWSDVAGTLSEHGRDRTRIYITLGHGGKATGDQLQPILDMCAELDCAAFVSLGFRPDDELPTLPPNVLAGGFTGISEPIRWSDIVINHGGYSTVLTSLMYGKPQIILPFMSEQEANGVLFAEAHHAGFVLRRTSRADGGSRHFTHRLRYSGESTAGQCTSEEWQSAIREILSDPSFAEGANRISEAIRSVTEARALPRTITAFLDRVR
ncbi:glycosyltransferase [Streptomyces avermitilis]|uniref:glycosyltransferase n=1 Tax=Streptomyces avermitilis TaxID=33903 RepID=UPI0033BF25F3